MIKFNETYTIQNGDKVTFTEGKKGTINGTYSDATLTGTLEGNLLKATFHNKKVNATGLKRFRCQVETRFGAWANAREVEWIVARRKQ
jgi:hypothetical protein